MEPERRHFNRVAFETDALLIYSKQQTACELLDLSLHGALIQLKQADLIESLTSDIDYRLVIPLDQESQKINMQLKLTHKEANHLGFECQHIELDSIIHLRRLVELNLGDSLLLDRDFAALCEQHT